MAGTGTGVFSRCILGKPRKAASLLAAGEYGLRGRKVQKSGEVLRAHLRPVGPHQIKVERDECAETPLSVARQTSVADPRAATIRSPSSMSAPEPRRGVTGCEAGMRPALRSDRSDSRMKRACPSVTVSQDGVTPESTVAMFISSSTRLIL